ncbi:hypothetical protein FIBSPDRAFT_889786 [Athelia psychrophila]|uniref:Uncharacterized protein n=1 Tax=Athelia psychrophila TaxID=1759441 RepID=A0A166LN19_9AGAM|nr:hypothetical protein FIBSPDRAFT_889786 [Fibularhizoctonia sp. CBS 109695]
MPQLHYKSQGFETGWLKQCGVGASWCSCAIAILTMELKEEDYPSQRIGETLMNPTVVQVKLVLRVHILFEPTSNNPVVIAVDGLGGSRLYCILVPFKNTSTALAILAVVGTLSYHPKGALSIVVGCPTIGLRAPNPDDPKDTIFFPRS